MNKFLKVWVFVTCVVVSFVCGFLANDWYYNDDQLFEANQFKAEVLNAYDEHYDNVEALLDSIASWNDSFMDTTRETDVYCNYCVSKEKVDSLYKTQE